MSFALAYAGETEYMRLPDNRKALGGLWELSIIVPLAAFSRAFGTEDCDLLASHAGTVMVQ